MPWLLKLSLIELIRHPRHALLASFTLAMGLMGLFLVETFHQSLSDYLAGRSQQILGADLAITGRFPLPPKKAQKLAQLLGTEEWLSLRQHVSMLRARGRSGLILLQEAHPDFPYYGELTLKSERPSRRALAQDEVWVYPEILSLFELQVGDQVRLGEALFTIREVVASESGQVFSWGALAPKVYLSKAGLQRTGLIQWGSTGQYGTYFKLPRQRELPPSRLQEIVELVDDTALRLKTPEDAADQVGRAMKRLNDFLGLVSLVAFLLALLGLFYLFRAYLNARAPHFALYKTLGLEGPRLWGLYLGQLLVLGVAATALALLLGQLPLLWAHERLLDSLPFALSTTPRWPAVLATAGIALGGNLLIGAPLLAPALSASPQSLWQRGEALGPGGKIPWPYFLPLLLFLLGLSVLLSHSWTVGPLFLALLGGAALLLFGLISLFFPLISRWSRRAPLPLMLALRSLVRHRLSSSTIALTLFLSALLISFIPALGRFLEREFSHDLKTPPPSLFLIDIQPDQRAPLQAYLQQQGLRLQDEAPLVRARLISKNGKALAIGREQGFSREAQDEMRSRNRGINLTYSLNTPLLQEEGLLEGEPLRAYGGEGLPGLSLSERYARRLDLKLGDELGFDIAGLPQTGVVVNIRRIRWSSLRPNFFITFAPGVLDEAPQTFIATLGPLEEKRQRDLTWQISERFPNISVIDLDRLVQKLRMVMGQMSRALLFMSALVFLSGLTVMGAMIGYQVASRERDLTLLYTLGLRARALGAMLLAEYGLILGLAVALGSLLGPLLAFAFYQRLFAGLAPFSWGETPLLAAGQWGLGGLYILICLLLFPWRKKMGRLR